MLDSDSEKIDAWLAGQLPPEEEKSLEKRLQEPQSDSDFDSLLLDLDQEVPRADSALTDLVESVKTQGAGHTTSPDSESWRETLTPTDDPDVAGLLGDYEVIGPIASGGMATVLEARDPKLDRIVALKVLPPELAANRSARARFLREARAAAKLEHENILPIHGVYEDNRCAFFSMRYIATGSLQDALDREEAFPFDRVKRIALGVASALSAAHSAGIVHRDIKPANILLGEHSDQLWVCDFGIAHSTGDPAQSDLSTISGTPQYMSPEQASGEEIDGRSDLFALGAVMFRCASGEPAFAGKTTSAVLEEIANSTPPRLDKLDAEFPAWFSELIATLLEKDPASRPADAEALLQRIQGNEAERRNFTFPWRPALIGIGVLLATCLAAIQFPATKDTINQRLLAPRGAQFFTIHNRIGVYETLSETIAAARDGDQIELPTGTIRIEPLMIPEGKRLTLTPTENGSRTRITSDGSSSHAISTASDLRLVDIDLVLSPSEKMEPMILIDGASLETNGCTFATHDHTMDTYFSADPCAVSLTNGSDVEISDCHFWSSISVPVRISGKGDFSIDLRDTTATTPNVVHIPQSESDPPEKISITMTRCDFTAVKFLQRDLTRDFAVSCEAQDSSFTINNYLAYFETDDPETSRQFFQWSGTGNRFPNGNANAYFGCPPHGRETLLIPIADVPPGIIEIAGSGRKFTDLSTATLEAPDGATLLLRGHFDCLSQIITPQGKTLKLRAAEGARPIVSTRLRKLPAIQFLGPTSLTGIRFVRYEPATNGKPIVGIRGAGGEIEVTDCSFFSTPSNPRVRYHRGLGITDFSSAKIRRCYLRTVGGYSLSVGANSGDVAVEDSLLIGLAAVELRHEPEDPKISLDIERSVIVGIDGVFRGSTGSSTPLGITMNNNIFYVALAGIALADVAGDELSDLITWRSKDNHVRAGSAFLRTFKVHAPRKFESILIDSDSERYRYFPAPDSISAEGSVFGNLFNFGDLPLHTITADSLRKTLDPSVDSLAEKTLEHFSIHLTSQ